MVPQPKSASLGVQDGGRSDDRGKKPIVGGGEEEAREEGEGPSSSSSPSFLSSSSSRTQQEHLVPVICDVCGEPKSASDICFDMVGCTHLLCFGCLSLRDVGEESAIGCLSLSFVIPCPVSGCKAGFLDQLPSDEPPPPVAVEDDQEIIADETLAASAPSMEAEAEEEAHAYFCSICMEHKPPEECFLDLQGCDHVFCAECIGGYVSAKVEENSIAIRCPDPECSEGKLEPEACRTVIPVHVFDRWGVALCEVAVGEKARFYCPYRDCSALLCNEGGEDEEGGRPMTDAECLHCGRVCCAQCRVPWHGGLTCEEYRKRAEAEAEAEQVMQMVRERQWQRCPKCGFVVERVEGCVFIRCRCSHCFCYRCASPLDSKDQSHFCRKCNLTWDNGH